MENERVVQAALDAYGVLYQAFHMRMCSEQEQSIEAMRPSTLYKPRLTKDGDAWIACFGEDLQVGVVGCGKTPAEAMSAFDDAWLKPDLEREQGEK